MRKSLPMFYSALLLTGVNLLLRLAGTSFQVYLSSRIGAAGIGLLQLTLSVGGMALVAGTAGIRTAAMYLTAEELGKRKPENIAWVLSGCIRYSICFSGCTALILILLSPMIAGNWIGEPEIQDALYLLAVFLPVSCLCGVMTGYFTAAQRIGTLAAVEVCEQLISMGVTLGLLRFYAGSNSVLACRCVILGSGTGSCVTLAVLAILRQRERVSPGPPIRIRGRLMDTALPLAVADNLRTGISTVENLIVPKRLALNPMIATPLAAFGMLSGMVFPLLMFPACILFGLAEILIPELARCAASGSHSRITYLVGRSLRVALLYGVLFGGTLYLAAEPLCIRLYDNGEAGTLLQVYALLVPMLYCDAITDAMIKGLGQQKVCVRYNILTNTMDVCLLYLLLPKYGLQGYFFSFLVTHLLNFGLSLRRLLKITDFPLPIFLSLRTLLAAGGALWGAQFLQQTLLRLMAYPALLFSVLYLLGVVSRDDLRWLRGLLNHKK